MSLKHSYSVLAPIYDSVVASATRGMRHHSLQRLNPPLAGQRILLAGIGTGLDIPFLPVGANYTGLDLTRAMLKRARQLSRQRTDIQLHQGDVLSMPYAHEQFDIVILHLILAVVPNPLLALQEAARVLKPNGQILLLDKFLRQGQWAPLRRLLNTVVRHVATRTDVVFEDLLSQCPQLQVTDDQPAMAAGWFRQITLQKHTS